MFSRQRGPAGTQSICGRSRRPHQRRRRAKGNPPDDGGSRGRPSDGMDPVFQAACSPAYRGRGTTRPARPATGRTAPPRGQGRRSRRRTLSRSSRSPLVPRVFAKILGSHGPERRWSTSLAGRPPPSSAGSLRGQPGVPPRRAPSAPTSPNAMAHRPGPPPQARWSAGAAAQRRHRLVEAVSVRGFAATPRRPCPRRLCRSLPQPKHLDAWLDGPGRSSRRPEPRSSTVSAIAALLGRGCHGPFGGRILDRNE